MPSSACLIFVLHLIQSPASEVVLLTFRVGLPTTPNPTKNIFHRRGHRLMQSGQFFIQIPHPGDSTLQLSSQQPK